jgi:2-iminobutanoate/2-iminopropanoate deaminase
MVKRRSIYLDDYSHATGIPVASVVGPMMASSIIAPFNPGTRTAPETAQEQLENLFRNAGNMLKAAGGSFDNVLRMTFYVSDISARDEVNPVWDRHFPDKASCPARYTQLLAGDHKRLMIQADFWAYLGE